MSTYQPRTTIEERNACDYGHAPTIASRTWDLIGDQDATTFAYSLAAQSLAEA